MGSRIDNRYENCQQKRAKPRLCNCTPIAQIGLSMWGVSAQNVEPFAMLYLRKSLRGDIAQRPGSEQRPVVHSALTHTSFPQCRPSAVRAVRFRLRRTCGVPHRVAPPRARHRHHHPEWQRIRGGPDSRLEPHSEVLEGRHLGQQGCPQGPAHKGNNPLSVHRGCAR